MLHLGEFSVGLQGPLLKTGLPIIKNVLKPLINTFLIPLGLTARASSIDAAVWRNFFGSGMTTFIVSNEEMNNIMKTIKSLKESSLLIGNLLKGKELKWSNIPVQGATWAAQGAMKAGKDIFRVDQDF